MYIGTSIPTYQHKREPSFIYTYTYIHFIYIFTQRHPHQSILKIITKEHILHLRPGGFLFLQAHEAEARAWQASIPYIQLILPPNPPTYDTIYQKLIEAISPSGDREAGAKVREQHSRELIVRGEVGKGVDGRVKDDDGDGGAGGDRDDPLELGNEGGFERALAAIVRRAEEQDHMV